jgi:hypothetical protein
MNDRFWAVQGYVTFVSYESTTYTRPGPHIVTARRCWSARTERARGSASRSGIWSAGSEAGVMSPTPQRRCRSAAFPAHLFLLAFAGNWGPFIGSAAPSSGYCYICVTGHAAPQQFVLPQVLCQFWLLVQCASRNEVEVNLRPTVSRQSVLVSDSHVEPMTRFLFSVWRLRVSCCGAPSLTRGWVCNLLVQLLLGLARAATVGSESHRSHDYILVSHLRLQFPVFISPQEQVGPVKPPSAEFPFVAPYDSQGYGGVFQPASTRGASRNRKTRVFYTREEKLG